MSAKRLRDKTTAAQHVLVMRVDNVLMVNEDVRKYYNAFERTHKKMACFK